MSSSFAVLAILCLLYTGSSSVDTGIELKINLNEFYSCEGYEDSTIAFTHAQLWMEKKNIVLINCTVVTKEDITDNLTAKVIARQCQKGLSSACEEFPEWTEDELCSRFFKTNEPYSVIIKKAVEDHTCPIKAGTYAAIAAEYQMVKEGEDAVKYQAMKGDWTVTVYFELNGKEAGCQTMEVTVDDNNKSKG